MQYGIMHFERRLVHMPNDDNKQRLVVTPRLQEVLQEKGIRQSELELLTGIEQSLLSRFDKQKRHSDIVLFKLAAALDCNIHDLFIVTYEKA